ncbi:hypothetical protein OsJ_20003 [Oryza sativa Japonica Group]|uniref:Uncharacterized protein n=1 Tax=Oryza sativa subsp. japonica TaxID=39947 RepID=B9FRB8_ORYSJ|nr:hypothetical protein OsJ_20003 [Oryza sativa Japonica Group]
MPHAGTPPRRRAQPQHQPPAGLGRADGVGAPPCGQPPAWRRTSTASVAAWGRVQGARDAASWGRDSHRVGRRLGAGTPRAGQLSAGAPPQVQ